MQKVTKDARKLSSLFLYKNKIAAFKKELKSFYIKLSTMHCWSPIFSKVSSFSETYKKWQFLILTIVKIK